MAEKQIKRVHPVFIFEFLRKYFLIILLPFLYGAVTGNFTFNDTVPALILIIYSVLKRIFFRYSLGGGKAITEKGIFLRRRTQIHKSKISTADIEYSFFHSLFNSAKLRIDAETPSRKHSVMTLPIGKNDVPQILSFFFHGKPKLLYRAPAFKTAVGTLAFARSAPGVLLLSSFFRSGGKVLGQEFKDRLTGTVSSVQSLLPQYLPPFLSAAAVILAAGRLITFLLFLAHQSNFKLFKKGGYLLISRGLVFRRINIIRIKNIRACLIRRTPLMQMCGLYQVCVCIAGYGKEKGELSILIPAESKTVLNKLFKKLVTSLPKAEAIRAPKNALRRYIIPPVGWLCGLLFSYAALCRFFPKHISFITLFFVFPVLYCAFMIFFRINIHRKLFVSSDGLSATAYRRLTIIQAMIIPGSLSEIKISQTVFQRRAELCSIILRIRGAPGQKIKLRHFSANDVRKTFLRGDP